jgi:hypothetical protein
VFGGKPAGGLPRASVVFYKGKKKQANKLMRRWENKNKAKRVLVKWTGAVQEAKIQLRAWPESS